MAAAAALDESASDVAALFSRTRLAGRRGLNFGSSDLAHDEAAILLERALPS
jgi:hypothetical protein